MTLEKHNLAKKIQQMAKLDQMIRKSFVKDASVLKKFKRLTERILSK